MTRNRAFWLGENFFTSFRTAKGKPLFLKEHLSRLFQDLAHFYDKVLPREKLNELRESINSMVEELSNKSLNRFIEASKESYFRISIIPNMTGVIPERDISLNFQIYLGELNPRIEIKRCCVKTREQGVMKFGKTGSYNQQVYDLMNVREDGFNEVIYCSPEGDLIEATTSNILVVDHEKRVVVRPVSKLLFSGITSLKLCPIWEKMNYRVENRNMNLTELKINHCLLLVNSVSLVTCGVLPSLTGVNESLARELNRKLIQKECN